MFFHFERRPLFPPSLPPYQFPCRIFAQTQSLVVLDLDHPSYQEFIDFWSNPELIQSPWVLHSSVAAPCFPMDLSLLELYSSFLKLKCFAPEKLPGSTMRF